MRAAATDAALVLMVASVWLACAGFVRLPSALDRLHTASFVYAAGGVTLLLAGALTDGFSARVLKIAFVLLCSLVGGAASVHAIGRALVSRGSVTHAELLAKLHRGDNP